MSRFEFATAGRILFGPGRAREAGDLARQFGSRVLVVAGRSRERVQLLLSDLGAQGLSAALFQVSGEPTLATIQQGLAEARRAECQLVLGFGGGSALDTAKAVAAMMTNPGELTDYLETVGRGRPLTEPPLPCLAIPTTAGTGSEATRNAVVSMPEQNIKVSLRSHLMFPKVAIVDPELCLSLPPQATAETGMDALAQLIEPCVSRSANPMTDALCLRGMELAARSLRKAFQDGGDIEARADMSLASLLSGMALANAGLGAVHGLAGPLGGRHPGLGHGAACARLLAPAMAANIRALRLRDPGNIALSKYSTIAKALTGEPGARAEDGAAWVEELARGLGIRPLSDYGVERTGIEETARRALEASSMRGNPAALSMEELAGILEAAL